MRYSFAESEVGLLLALVIGGAASGKSEFAESLAMSLSAERYYVATMQSYDAECDRRIERHRNMRSGKGFVTVERSLDLAGMELECGDAAVVLLECASTLLGNELCMPGGAGAASWQAILTGAERLVSRGIFVVIVTNDVFGEGEAATPEMREYSRQLGLLNQGLADIADLVVEVVCGLPQVHKGGLILHN